MGAADLLLGALRLLWPGALRTAADSCSASASAGDIRALPSNSLLWTCVAFAVAYALFGRILRAILLRYRVPAHRCAATIRYAWTGSVMLAAAFSLAVYYHLALAAAIRRDSGPLFPKYASALEMRSGGGGGGGSGGGGGCGASGGSGGAFGQIGTMLTAYYVCSAVVAANAQDGGEAVANGLFAVVLHGLLMNGLENFTVLLNIWLGLFHAATAAIHTAALHARPANAPLMRFLLALRLLSWCYVYLHLLPFDFLLAATASRPHWLNATLWLWYGTGVWWSPVLLFCYHRVYWRPPPETRRPAAKLSQSRQSSPPTTPTTGRSAAADAGDGGWRTKGTADNGGAGGQDGETIMRRVLVRQTPEYQQYVQLQMALLEIQLANKQLERKADPGSNSSRAYQTIKCMMTLKKKLKRIRESNQTAMHAMLP